jgi:hypothetical protein
LLEGSRLHRGACHHGDRAASESWLGARVVIHLGWFYGLEIVMPSVREFLGPKKGQEVEEIVSSRDVGPSPSPLSIVADDVADVRAAAAKVRARKGIEDVSWVEVDDQGALGRDDGPSVSPATSIASKAPLPDSFELALNHLEGTLARIVSDTNLAIDQVKALRERAHFDQEKLDRLDKIDALLR